MENLQNCLEVECAHLMIVTEKKRSSHSNSTLFRKVASGKR